MQLHPLTAAHWPEVRAIYEQGIATGHATFQTEAPTWEEWDRSHLPHSRLVAVDAGYGHTGQVLGCGRPSRRCQAAACTAAWPR